MLRKKLILSFCALCIVALSACCIAYMCGAPSKNQMQTQLQVEKGMTVKAIAQKAKELHIVRSATFLYLILSYQYDPTLIYAGVYSFPEPVSVFSVAHKLAQSDIDTALLTITIPEGSTRRDIARIARKLIPTFDTETFMEITTDKEGYLFPDTYNINREYTAKELATLLHETFLQKISVFQEQIALSTLQLSDIIILASLLEKEANSTTSMKMVSGILQNRLRENTALQVDASIGYVLNKPLQKLQPEDLKIDSPYNTYVTVGLPPTAIANPGLQAIEAVLNATTSSFMFYVTGDDGNFYYAKTFEEHKRNIARYLH